MNILSFHQDIPDQASLDAQIQQRSQIVPVAQLLGEFRGHGRDPDHLQGIGRVAFLRIPRRQNSSFRGLHAAPEMPPGLPGYRQALESATDAFVPAFDMTGVYPPPAKAGGYGAGRTTKEE